VTQKYSTALPHESALVVQGGAMRSVFSAGVLDGFLDRQFNPFDFYIGVSAGASNLAAYLSGESGKSMQIFRDFARRPEFMNFGRFLRGGHLLDLDWLFEITFGRTHFDLSAIYNHAKPLYVCVTEVETGSAIYVDTNANNLAQALKASTALPVFYRGFPLLNGRAMTDGGVADAIPVARAIELGAKKIMVVRSRPANFRVTDTLAHRWIRRQMRRYPQLHATMKQRVQRHEAALVLIRNPPDEVKIVEVCPPAKFTAGRFSRGSEKLELGYQAGQQAADWATEQW
jgi:predicted patatin/cPLA2 family phospholipase